MNSPLAVYNENEPGIRLRGLTLFVLIGGVLYFSAAAAMTAVSPFFYAAPALLFIPLLFLSKPITLSVYVLSFAYAVPLVQIGANIHIRIDDFAFLIIALFWITDKAISSEKTTVDRTIAKLLLIWLGINALVVLINQPFLGRTALYRSGYYFLRFSQYIFVYFIVSDFIKNERTQQNILRSIWVSTIFICFYSLYQIFALGYNRASGPLSDNHAHLGAYMLLIIFIMPGLVKLSRNIVEKSLVIFSLPLMIYILFLSASRAAIIGLFFGVLLALLFSKKPVLIFSAILFFAVGIVIGIDSLGNLQELGLGKAQFASAGTDISMFGRFMIWIGAVDFIQNNPVVLITGTGLAGFEKAVTPYVQILRHASGAHNNYLHHLIETGIAGFGIFIYLMYTLLRVSIRRSREQYRKNRALYYGYFCGLSALLISGLTQETFSVQTSLSNFLGFFFLVTAVVFAQPGEKAKTTYYSGN